MLDRPTPASVVEMGRRNALRLLRPTATDARENNSDFITTGTTPAGDIKLEAWQLLAQLVKA